MSQYWLKFIWESENEQATGRSHATSYFDPRFASPVRPPIALPSAPTYENIHIASRGCLVSFPKEFPVPSAGGH